MHSRSEITTRRLGPRRSSAARRVRSVARAECQLERQRRVRPETAARLKAGARVEVPRFGVDPDVCTGDKSCMRFNGCPSLTLKPATDPLKDGPTAHIDASCVACGLCGEVVRATALCPSFHEARRTVNPTPWQRFGDRFSRRLLAAMGA